MHHCQLGMLSHGIGKGIDGRPLVHAVQVTQGQVPGQWWDVDNRWAVQVRRSCGKIKRESSTLSKTKTMVDIHTPHQLHCPTPSLWNRSGKSTVRQILGHYKWLYWNDLTNQRGNMIINPHSETINCQYCQGSRWVGFICWGEEDEISHVIHLNNAREDEQNKMVCVNDAVAQQRLDTHKSELIELNWLQNFRQVSFVNKLHNACRTFADQRFELKVT